MPAFPVDLIERRNNLPLYAELNDEIVQLEGYGQHGVMVAIYNAARERGIDANGLPLPIGLHREDLEGDSGRN